MPSFFLLLVLLCRAMSFKNKIFKLISVQIQKLCIVLIVLMLLNLFFEVYILPGSENDAFGSKHFIDKPIILWWTPFIAHDGLVGKNCGGSQCYFTQDRQYLFHDNLKVIAFYGSNLNLTDLPVQRIASENGPFWALVHEESPKNMPVLLHNVTLNLFNFSSTFSRYSDFPLTTLYLSNLRELVGSEFLVSLEEKNSLLSELAPVLYIQSDCSTPVNRDAYVAELMKHISIDSYGECLNNKKLPKEIADRLKTINVEEHEKKFLHFIARYKFILAFENSICHDYITEKLWRPLIVGSVPIYLGSPTVEDWLPNDNSAIIVSKFQSPQELAAYIHRINKNDSEYQNYVRHKQVDISVLRRLKTQKNIRNLSNKLLIRTMVERKWQSSHHSHVQFPEAFECFLCEKLSFPVIKSIVDDSHYNCPEPVSPLNHQINESNWWHGQWKLGQCEGQVLKESISKRKQLATEELYEKLLYYLNNEKC